ncbi:MAG: hypothetical protein QXP91_01140 [Candidatus Methanomethylicia archaeon]
MFNACKISLSVTAENHNLLASKYLLICFNISRTSNAILSPSESASRASRA